MNIPTIRNSAPGKFIKSLYYANRPIQYYKPKPQELACLRKPENKFISWLKGLLKK